MLFFFIVCNPFYVKSDIGLALPMLNNKSDNQPVVKHYFTT